MPDKPRLENAQPLCPLVGMPPMQRAWSAKPGDVVFLRMPNGAAWAAYEQANETLKTVTDKTGVHFVLLAPGTELVAPPEPGDPGPIETVEVMKRV